jgi:hypothetical protein
MLILRILVRSLMSQFDLNLINIAFVGPWSLTRKYCIWPDSVFLNSKSPKWEMLILLKTTIPSTSNALGAVSILVSKCLIEVYLIEVKVFLKQIPSMPIGPVKDQQSSFLLIALNAANLIQGDTRWLKKAHFIDSISLVALP